MGNRSTLEIRMKDIIIHDDFITPAEAMFIENMCLGQIKWEFNQQKVYPHSDIRILDYQFTCVLFDTYSMDKHKNVSAIYPIINKIETTEKIASIRRIKINLEPCVPEKVYSDFHTDYPDGQPDMKVGIYYVNTCNGYTEFEDGSKVESVKGRFVEFPNKIKHRGVSQTDSKYRLVINFNWF